jgi:hypothetical protein
LNIESRYLVTLIGNPCNDLPRQSASRKFDFGSGQQRLAPPGRCAIALHGGME